MIARMKIASNNFRLDLQKIDHSINRIFQGLNSSQIRKRRKSQRLREHVQHLFLLMGIKHNKHLLLLLLLLPGVVIREEERRKNPDLPQHELISRGRIIRPQRIILKRMKETCWKFQLVSYMLTNSIRRKKTHKTLKIIQIRKKIRLTQLLIRHPPQKKKTKMPEKV